jgi:hypothetical protein
MNPKNILGLQKLFQFRRETLVDPHIPAEIAARASGSAGLQSDRLNFGDFQDSISSVLCRREYCGWRPRSGAYMVGAVTN